MHAWETFPSSIYYIERLKEDPVYFEYLMKEKSFAFRSEASYYGMKVKDSPEFMESLRSACDSIKMNMQEKFKEEEYRRILGEEGKEKMDEYKKQIDVLTAQRDQYKRQLDSIQHDIGNKKEGNLFKIA